MTLILYNGDGIYLKVKLAKHFFCPSASISDAWMVVEKMSHFDTNARLRLSESHGRTGTSWTAVFKKTDGSKWAATAATAPFAICLAAIACVEGTH